MDNNAILSDDNMLLKEIVAAHDPEPELKYDAKQILNIAEDLLKFATLSTESVSTGAVAHVDQLENPRPIMNPDDVFFKIYRISNEIETYFSWGNNNANTATVGIFDSLKNYEWDVKLVLALAGFSNTICSKFWFWHVHKDSTNPLAKSMAKIKKVPTILVHVNTLMPWFEALNELVKVLLEVARFAIEFSSLQTRYISQHSSSYNIASHHIQIATYWSIRGMMTYAFQIMTLTAYGTDGFLPSITELGWQLSTLAHKLKTKLEHLRKNLDSCNREIEERKDHEAYKLLCELFVRPHSDNMKVLKALISAKDDDDEPLYDGGSKKRVSLEPLRRKNVLLLISGFDQELEVLILQQMYNESSVLERRYEIVWLPIVEIYQSSDELTQQKQRQFEDLKLSLPWFSVYDPSTISKPVKWFIRREWKYKSKPILVALDPQGRVACPNAIHMMWIWGTAAFPFTRAVEEALWREETWRLELLVDGIDSEIFHWIKNDKFIFLYGGNDSDWVIKFVKEARKVELAAQINLEMVYVGNKSNERNQVQKVLDTITREKLQTHSWQDHNMIWFFWSRLESMLFSKIQLKQANDDADLVMQEVKKLLSYDKLGGWIVLVRGSHIIVNGHAIAGLQTLMEYERVWRVHAEREGFEQGFREHYGKLHEVDRPCCRVEFSNEMGKMPEKMGCPECRRNMHMLTMFHCCHDETVDQAFPVSVVAPAPTI